MKPSELYEALHALIGERVPVHIWGACALRVATAHDATALLYEMDAVLREREGASVASDAGTIADSIVSHMSAYMVPVPE